KYALEFNGTFLQGGTAYALDGEQLFQPAPGHHQCYTLARTCLALRPWPADLLDAATIDHYDAASDRHGRASKGAHDRALVVLHEMGGIWHLGCQQRGHLIAPPVMPLMNRSRKRL